ncbi:DinB family protein [uncultured Polaribacter sp.]|uniref:DinB family protein n=1 Tax=uncultured Polaribacter sp. TaxID=174711 RepID=UPI0026284976|nr:DinB family protein [uncultured Polaribacter sp.]
MIETIAQNLEKGIQLLKSISDEEYSDRSVAPYYSSIGCHIRHVLDVFSCIFKGLENKAIDFSIRDRNELVELKTTIGIAYFETIIFQLYKIKKEDFNKIVKVSDDLGQGIETANYTLAAVLMQTQSHTTHHYASIGYLIYQLGIELPNTNFGFNPTTPIKVRN